MSKLVSFNCKGVKRSVDHVRDLCQSCDIIALQETWLMPDDIQFLGDIDQRFGHTGTSAVDTSAGMLRGLWGGGRTTVEQKCLPECVGGAV